MGVLFIESGLAFWKRNIYIQRIYNLLPIVFWVDVVIRQKLVVAMNEWKD